MPIPRRSTVERRIQERIDAIDARINRDPRLHREWGWWARGLRDALAIVRGESPEQPGESPP